MQQYLRRKYQDEMAQRPIYGHNRKYMVLETLNLPFFFSRHLLHADSDELARKSIDSDHGKRWTGEDSTLPAIVLRYLLFGN